MRFRKQRESSTLYVLLIIWKNYLFLFKRVYLTTYILG